MIKYLKTKMPKFLKGRDRDTHEYAARDTDTTYNLGWIDTFVQKIKPYVYVRELDRLLILIPNQAYRLNPTGVALLKYLLQGNSIREFLRTVGDSQARRKDIHYFFCDLRAAVTGCLKDNEQRHAVSYYEFNGICNEYPVLSEVAVTYRCNLRCDFCYVGNVQCDELNTNDIKKVLFKIHHEAQIPSVSFTGGEPLVREDIVELVAYAARIGLWTNLITNGTLLTQENVLSLKKAGLSSTQVSIEGPCAEIHDAITGVAGSFNATLNGIQLLLNAQIPVHTNTTVSQRNHGYLEEILLLVKKIGLKRLSMNLVIPCGSAQNKKHIWVAYSDIGDQILKLKHRAEKEGITFLWYSPLPLCHFNPIAHGFGNKSCAAITGLLSIDPLGNIIPCSSWREPVSSLLKGTFKDIWASSFLSYFKHGDYAPRECRSCTDFDVCRGACPLYWQACGLQELHGRT